MRLCLACYGTRLAVLFDNATTFRIYDVEDEHICPAGHISLPFGDLPSKVSSIRSCGVNTLICGGISGCTLRLITGARIEVIPWICGETDQVLSAWQRNTLENMTMPGCKGACRNGGRGQGRRCGHGQQYKVSPLNKPTIINKNKDKA
jgi:predicted Fe-Mo cluster-binding NifX family protein